MKKEPGLVGRILFRIAMNAVLIGMSLSAQSAESPASLASESAAVPISSLANYTVAIGDELRFKFFYMPELDTVAVVRPDGRVTLPLIGEMTVVGSSLKTLSEQVEQALSERVRRPQVAINVQGPIASQRVFIGGEVARPGVQALVGALTVMQAVIAAEGLKDSAQPKEVTVLRRRPSGEPVVLKLDLAAAMQGREGAADIALAPYDVVVVPRSGIADVGVWVDQYVRRVLPINLGFSYTVNREGVVR